ncbi:putative DNA binding protein [Tripterygium wilfordii]|uniref:Putative DNA binding protein n=1 Tax=Tripterygium wilfordii TaxID=458696 RepID=A0A7J7C4Q3_TRIWF|nr:putative DNA binding protein [Tripterygium wilfordii]
MLQEPASVADQLYEAENYIKKLQISLEKLKERKDSLMGIQRSFTGNNCVGTSGTGTRLPQIEIHENDLALEIVLITGLDRQFIFTETIRVLYEEGVEIVNASFSVVQDTVFHTIHSKLEESASGNEVARISERLRRFVV